MGPRKLIVKGSLAGLLGQGSSAWQKAPSWHYSRLFAQLCRPNLAPAVMPAAVGAARASGTRMLVRHGFRFRTTSQTTGGREMTLWSIQRVWPAERKLACTKQASSSSLLSCWWASPECYKWRSREKRHEMPLWIVARGRSPGSFRARPIRCLAGS